MVITESGDRVMSAPEAAAAAGITYRQLDYWDRQKWIRPSDIHKVGSGRAVRRYGLSEVVRLQALAHLGRSGVELAAFAPAINGVELGHDDALLVGPFGVSGAEPEAFVVTRDEVLAVASRPGRWVAYDPRPLIIELRSDASTVTSPPAAARSSRRTA